ncbi:hypothetical protein DW095_10705 [Bacteroides sp. AM07-16]|nr:hypothetical protein DW095_10705 [Bacteroides sp. AM07-16]
MKHYLYLLAVVAGLVLGGCSEDVIGGGGETPNDDGAARLKITFSNGGAATRALGDPFASELAEKTINRLSFYVYPAKEADKDLVPFQRYVFDMSTLPLEKDSVTIQHVTGTDATDGYTCNFILREGAGFECIIVAIANAPDNFDETNNLNTYEKLQQAYIDCSTMPNTPDADLTASTREDKYGLVMYAEDTRMIKKTLTTDVSFKMERLAARIDISNAAYSEDEAKGFVLQSARIINGKHTSYAIPSLTEPWTHPGLTKNFDAITSVDKADAFLLASANGQLSDGNTTDASGNAVVADPSIDAGEVEQRLWHELYTYENDDEVETTATTVEIKGLFRGAPFSRILPFVNKDKKPVIIERNHRYLVRLNPAPGLTDLTYNITVADWNAVDTINVKPSQKEKPEITYSPSFTPGADKTLELYKNVVTFTLDAVCSFDTEYQVIPETGDPAGTDVSWLTVTPGEPEIVTRAATGVKRTYTVVTTEMSTGTSRRAMLLIGSGANFTARDTVHIKQSVYYPGTTLQAVLYKGQYWAPVNCGASTVPTKTEATWDVATCGYLYQWGRKVPFSYGTTLDLAPDGTFPTYVEAITAGYTYADKFIKGNSTADYSWFSDYKGTLSPALTVGDNAWPRENQPCPAGWRVPTKAELDPIMNEAKGSNKMDNTNKIWKAAENNQFVLPAAGYRYRADGSSGNLASYGRYWSSTLNETGQSPSLGFSSSVATTSEGSLALGFSVRCVQE